MKGLPSTRGLTPMFVASCLVAVIAGLASIAGVRYGSELYGAGPIAAVAAGPAGVLVPGFVAQDVLTLTVGLPVLLIVLFFVRRGSFMGLLLWPGMLFNLLYTYVHYLVGAPFGVLFLAYVALVTLCAFTVAALLSSVDGHAVAGRIGARLRARTIGGILVVLALMTVGQDASGALSTALSAGPPVDPEARRVWTADLATAAPAMLVAGVLLWRRAALGVVAVPGLFLSFSLFSAELAVMLALQPWLTGASIDAGTMVGLLVFTGAGLIPLILIGRAAAVGHPAGPRPADPMTAR